MADEPAKPLGATDYAIATIKLCRDFGGFRAVDELDLRVDAGTLYGFLGRNGAGKSTTIKMLTGILAPSSGSISLLGANPGDENEAAEVRRRIGVVPEDLALFELLTGREYLDFVGAIYQLDEAVVRERVDELFDVLNVGGGEKQLVLEYSHGMRKKLALAAALIADPALLFLDEPFEGVDAVSSRVMRELLQRFVARGGTVFITSHVLDVVERLCTHVGIIDRGRLVYEAPLSELDGSTLESVFIDRVGDAAGMRTDLSWLREDVG